MSVALRSMAKLLREIYGHFLPDSFDEDSANRSKENRKVISVYVPTTGSFMYVMDRKKLY